MKTFTFMRNTYFLFLFFIFSLTAISQNTPINCDGKFFLSYGNGSFDPDNSTVMKQLGFSGSTVTEAVFNTNPNNIGYNAMGLNPIDGYIYAVRYPANNSKAHLVRIGAVPNNVTDLGLISNINDDEVIGGGCFSADGTFYFVSISNNFYKITPAELRGSAPYSAIEIGTNFNLPDDRYFADIAIDPVTGQMYGSTANASSHSNRIYTIDKSTGATNNVGTYPDGSNNGDIIGLFFTEEGNLYGYRSDGVFLKLDKSNAANSTQAGGSGIFHNLADGCSCSFRVGHDLKGPGEICVTSSNPFPSFNFTVTIQNQYTALTGISYELILDSRFSFTQTGATALTALPSNLKDGTTSVSITSVSGGINNKVAITNLKIPFGMAPNTYSFTLGARLSKTGNYTTASLQSKIIGLPAGIGTFDLSNDPTTATPDDVTKITFCSNIALPVELVSFKGNLVNSFAKLGWESATESNIETYTVQRSVNGSDFKDAGVVDAIGKASVYSFNDPVVNTGEKVYYRLKISGKTGYSYSSIVMLQTNLIAGNINAGPNPFKKEIQVSVTSAENTDLSYTLSTADGKLLKKDNRKVSKGTNNFTISDLGSLQAGMYFLQIDFDNTIKTIKLLKN